MIITRRERGNLSLLSTNANEVKSRFLLGQSEAVPPSAAEPIIPLFSSVVTEISTWLYMHMYNQPMPFLFITRLVSLSKIHFSDGAVRYIEYTKGFMVFEKYSSALT